MRPQISKAARILLLACLSTSLAACAPGAQATPQGNPPQNVALLQSKIQRETTPNASEQEMAELVAGDSAFAFDLYQALRGEAGNLFYSPYSLSIALAMTYAGARGETEQQMATTLHYTLPQEQLHPAFNGLDLALADEGDQQEGAFRLDVANSLWGQEDFPFRQEYLDLIARNYGSGLRLVDYIDDTQREQARQAINDWVNAATQGKIEELIGKDILTDATRLVLANAIYFKGEWSEPFLNGTREAPFTRLDGSQVSVPTMSRRATTPYLSGEDFQAVDLPYKGGRIAMLVVLPSEGQFEAFESGLNRERMQTILQGLEASDVKLYMPKFQFSTAYKLADTLKAMGMPDAFDKGRADFSGMYDPQKVAGNLYLSHVVHKAYVAVDEIGTEAAAASGEVAEITSMPIALRIDRPFLFLIHDMQTGTILFAGRVVDPQSE
ncbi:MAG: serpin family protein [Anaerolineales bacterium]